MQSGNNLKSCFLVLLASAFISGRCEAGGVVEVLPATFRGASQPEVAVDGRGGVFVAFGRDSRVWCAVSTNGGLVFASPVAVGELSKLALGMRRGPRIVATEKGVVVSAISHDDGGLRSWFSGDGGRTWSTGVVVNSAARSAREGLHGMAGNGSGRVVVAWLDLRDGGTELWTAVSKDGGRTWGKDGLIYKSPDGHICECCHPSVFVGRDDSVRAMWRNWVGGARDFWIAESADGVNYSAARKLGITSWKLNACPMDGRSIAGDEFAWRGEHGIYLGAEGTDEKLLDEGGRQPVATKDRGGVDVAWQNGQRLMLHRAKTGQTEILAEDAAYAAMAPGMVVWEGRTNGQTTVLAKALE